MPVPQTQVIIDWITSLGWNALQEPAIGFPLFPGPLILAEPDRSVWITMTGGPGYMTDEGAADAWTFQARVRGPSDDTFTPESMAILLDQMILQAQFPVQVDGVSLQNAHRTGSPPAPLPVDPSDLRHEFTCSYTIVTGV